MRDYHVHTVNSPDGHATIREQFTAAQAAGLEGNLPDRPFGHKLLQSRV